MEHMSLYFYSSTVMAKNNLEKNLQKINHAF
jgi:hypothetical protein